MTIVNGYRKRDPSLELVFDLSEVPQSDSRDVLEPNGCIKVKSDDWESVLRHLAICAHTSWVGAGDHEVRQSPLQRFCYSLCTDGYPGVALWPMIKLHPQRYMLHDMELFQGPYYIVNHLTLERHNGESDVQHEWRFYFKDSRDLWLIEHYDAAKIEVTKDGSLLFLADPGLHLQSPHFGIARVGEPHWPYAIKYVADWHGHLAMVKYLLWQHDENPLTALNKAPYPVRGAARQLAQRLSDIERFITAVIEGSERRPDDHLVLGQRLDSLLTTEYGESVLVALTLEPGIVGALARQVFKHLELLRSNVRNRGG